MVEGVKATKLNDEKKEKNFNEERQVKLIRRLDECTISWG